MFISSESNVIGGDQPEMRNVISGNDEMGILIAGFVSGNRVEGNYIGTNADGDADLGNTEDGVTVFNASDNTIGGTAEGARNVISGNGTYGVFISGSGATGNEVLGNYIGTRASGSGALANALVGVSIQGGDFNVVGTTDRGAANRIAYNGADGVSVVNSSSTGNSIVSNSIHSNAELGYNLSHQKQRYRHHDHLRQAQQRPLPGVHHPVLPDTERHVGLRLRRGLAASGYDERLDQRQRECSVHVRERFPDTRADTNADGKCDGDERSEWRQLRVLEEQDRHRRPVRSGPTT